MKGRVVTAAVAAACLALPVPASSAPRPARPARPVLGAAERARLVARLPVDAAFARDHDPNALDYAAIVASGDLDGDGGADVVDYRSRLVPDPVTGLLTEDVRIEVFRGRDGGPLWTKALPRASLHVPFVTRVGSANGVVVVTYGAGGPLTYDTTVTAYDARGGEVWARTFEGFSTPAPVGLRTTVDGVVGNALVVTTRVAASAASAAEGASVARTRVSVVDTATGDVRDVGGLVADPYYGLRAVPVGDLDGDRADDVVLVDGEDAGRGSMTALSLRSGVTLWNATALPANDRWVVRGIPDATGDGVADVTVAAVAARVDDPLPAEVALVDGARGTTAWRRPGDGALAIGDVDGRRGSEVVVGLGGEAKLALTAYDGRGAVRWRAARALDAREAIHTEAQWYDAGDVGPDGVRDVGYLVVSRDNDRERRDRGVVDGRTGRVRGDALPDMVTSVRPIDGRGSDSFVLAGPGFTLSAYRGNGAQRLWVSGVNAAGNAYGATTLDLDGDRCAEVVISVNEAGALTAYAFSGATGRPLWRLVRWHHEPGRVSRPEPLGHRRFVPTC